MNERPRAAHYRLRALLEVELRHRVGFACREGRRRGGVEAPILPIYGLTGGGLEQAPSAKHLIPSRDISPFRGTSMSIDGADRT